ncbi:MAG TPA: SCO family protein [Elusimicrobia bacterium]|nr:SCO family protein [Elusimicrobiota bacterium]
MRRWAAACLLSLAISPSAGAQGPGEVGLDEKLGAAIPLETRFLDEEGRSVELAALIDKPTVLTLNYFRCAGICTPLLNGLTDALNRVGLEPGRDFQVVTVSFDERDTPEIAKTKRLNYLKQIRRPFPPSAWRFLTGKGPAIKALTDAVGFEFKPWGEEYVHPGVIVLLSPKGRITRYMYGTLFPRYDLEMALREAARGKARPTIVKALEFCYSYDPQGRRVVSKATRAVGAAMLLFVAGFAAMLAWGGKRKGP